MTPEELIAMGQEFRGQSDQYSELITELADALEQAQEKLNLLQSARDRGIERVEAKLREAEDNLARAEETIAKVRTQIPRAYMYATPANHGSIFNIASILADYDSDEEES